MMMYLISASCMSWLTTEAVDDNMTDSSLPAILMTTPGDRRAITTYQFVAHTRQ